MFRGIAVSALPETGVTVRVGESATALTAISTVAKLLELAVPSLVR